MPDWEHKALPGAHPRAGGENGGVNLQTFETDGSSPRGRGKPPGIGIPKSRVRLIPARAGKTLRPGVLGCPAAAHPRAGGENVLAAPMIDFTLGSSPRGRGKRTEVVDVAAASRLIPARAGKTLSGFFFTISLPAHPRAGGENLYMPRVNFNTPGSSPRGRGKLSRVGQLHDFLGLIPARAGKTPGNPHRQCTFAAHPRAGGENVGHVERDALVGGSSPRGRGKLWRPWCTR